MSSIAIASTDPEAVGLLERARYPVRFFETAAALLAEADPGQVAVLAAADNLTIERLQARQVPVPVLVMSEDPQAALAAGADATLARPLKAQTLCAWIETLLRQRRRFEGLLERQRELEELSRRDGLTSLFNHRWLKERLAEEFRRAQRHGDPLALLMIDLDGFKGLNDKRGHPFGDRVLRAIAEIITRSVRETDLCARYGGEEFAVLLPRTTLSGALTVANRVWSGADELRVDGEQMTLSLGVAVGPTPQLRTPELLVRAADEALYRAKREGKNRICIDPQTQFRALA